ncbi:hypothetical protein [Vogesella indigofera]|uniref:Uncharacterized protein n=1 Tax=Vogesella indigofera TaxID=45465 RepID=A0ABT5I0V5_VOGIN|nr:hypothetical protein [Vogesella indigofera]MDC7689791.1 hypothetical protein [Vogesella indigofera]
MSIRKHNLCSTEQKVPQKNMETFISAMQVLNAVAKQIPLPMEWEKAMDALKTNTHVFHSEEGDNFNKNANKFLNGLSRKQFSIYYCRSEAASKLQALFHNAKEEICCYDTQETGQALKSNTVMSQVIVALGHILHDFDMIYRVAKSGVDPFPDPFVPSQSNDRLRLLSSVGFSRQQLDEYFAVRNMMNPLVDVEVDEDPIYIFGTGANVGGVVSPVFLNQKIETHVQLANKIQFAHQVQVVNHNVINNCAEESGGETGDSVGNVFEDIGDGRGFEFQNEEELDSSASNDQNGKNIESDADKVFSIVKEIENKNRSAIDRRVASDFGVSANFLEGRFDLCRLDSCAKHIAAILEKYLEGRVYFEEEEVIGLVASLARAGDRFFYYKKKKLHIKDNQKGEIQLDNKLLKSRIKTLQKRDRLRQAVENSKIKKDVD